MFNCGHPLPSEPVLFSLRGGGGGGGGGDGGQRQRTCQRCHMGRPNLVSLYAVERMPSREDCTDDAAAASIYHGFSSTPGHMGALMHRHSATAVR